ncbi:MAG: hypothetical protein MJZ68_02135, partial [archaeon]|nr:hypothetical protein [archaeon]
APRGDRPQGSGAPRGDRPFTPKTSTGAAKPSFDSDSDKDADLGSEGLGDAPKAAFIKKPESNYSMSYRGSSQRASAGRSGPSPNRQVKKGNSGAKPNKEASKRQSMLNTHKLNPFKYDMNEILSQSSMDPTMASSFLATVIAKASRISTRDAKDYAKTFVDEGNLTKDEFDKVSKLMDRYSKYR